MAQQVEISLSISADEYLKMYQGRASNVVARALDGRRIRFPAHILKPFVSHTGVQGHFLINFDAQNRFQSIVKIS
ncbi:uncharacterized protein DUF2835 [Alteromonadaceae bacterium 2753L.S.0a.02]|nr:uncharacterized protein DUF2835 [Alteromonadaceae bacterium 2753L.S.0a.02]